LRANVHAVAGAEPNAGDEHRLVQPRILRVRHDKAATSCTLDQLNYTDRRVILPVSKEHA
jgi:hypothetical protein